MSLHWLSLNTRVEQKVLLLVHKALPRLITTHIRQLLTNCQPPRCLSSYNKKHPVKHKANIKSTGNWVFSVYAPCLCNRLDLRIRQSKSLSKFKTAIQTPLFLVSLQ